MLRVISEKIISWLHNIDTFARKKRKLHNIFVRPSKNGHKERKIMQLFLHERRLIQDIAFFALVKTDN